MGPGPQHRSDLRQGRGTRADRRGPAIRAPVRDSPADFPSGLLDRRAGHRDFGPRRRHGRRPPEHRRAARPHRDPAARAAGTTLRDPAAADAGDPRRHPARRGRRRTFVIPTFAVRESLRPPAQQVHTLQGAPCMVQVRERLIPILHIGELSSASRPRRAADPPRARSWCAKTTAAPVALVGRRTARQTGSRDQSPRRDLPPACAASPAAPFSATAASG